MVKSVNIYDKIFYIISYKIYNIKFYKKNNIDLYKLKIKIKIYLIFNI